MFNQVFSPKVTSSQLIDHCGPVVRHSVVFDGLCVSRRVQERVARMFVLG